MIEDFPRPLRDQAAPGTVEAEIARHLREVVAHRPDLSRAVHRVAARGIGLARPGWSGFAGVVAASAVAGAVLAASGVWWNHQRSGTAASAEPVAIDVDTARVPRLEEPRTLPPRPASGPSGCAASGQGDLGVCTATYLGGPGDDAPVAVDIDAHGTVVYAGTLEGSDLGVQPHRLLGGGAGAVVRLGRAGRQVLSVTRLGRAISDLKVDAQGHLVVLGVPFGLAVLDGEGASVLWTAPGVSGRLAIGTDGTIAVLDPARPAVVLFAADGTALGSISLDAGRETIADLAVHAGSRSVIVVGSVIGVPGQPLVRSYGYDGEPRWQDWGWSPGEALGRGLRAAGNGLRITIGADDKIYVVGQSNGGRSAFFVDPHNPAHPLANVVLDDYTFAGNVGNQWYIAIARLSPADGAVEALQFHLTRDTDEVRRGRTMWPRSLAVDEHGQVLIAGYQSCCMEGQSNKTVAGVKLAPSAGDAFVLGLGAGFRSRSLWHTFGTGAPSMGMAVAVRGGLAAMIAVQEEAAWRQAPLVTKDPVQGLPAGGAEAWLVVWTP